MREQIYRLIRKAAPDERFSKLYDIFIVAVAFLSISPLLFKETHPVLEAIDLVTVYILFADYIFRWITCDYAGKENGSRLKGARAFIAYPFTPFAILDLLSLLPSMGLLSPGLRMLRMFRIFKILHYSRNFSYIAKVFQKERKTLASVLYIALFYIFVSALVMFSYEPDTFDSFFDACYWATTALTTVGYGDVYPVSAIGKLISMVSSLFGIAVIALPAGIVTASFVDEINNGGRESEAAAIAEPRADSPARTNIPEAKRYAAVMLIGVAMDVGLSAIAQALQLPLWLDVTGTAFTAIVLGPAAGLLVGLANNFILAVFGNGAGSLLYYAISASVALIAGLYLKRESRPAPRRILSAMLLVMLVSAVLSAGIDFWITWGQAPDAIWENYYYGVAMAAGVPHALSCLWGALAVKFFDTAVSAAIVALCYVVLPNRLRYPKF